MLVGRKEFGARLRTNDCFLRFLRFFAANPQISLRKNGRCAVLRIAGALTRLADQLRSRLRTGILHFSSFNPVSGAKLSITAMLRPENRPTPLVVEV
jgi:hypothetical protein